MKIKMIKLNHHNTLYFNLSYPLYATYTAFYHTLTNTIPHTHTTK